MKIGVSITTVVERADGTSTEHTENYVYTEGDNPRFEESGIVTAVTKSAQHYIGRVTT